MWLVRGWFLPAARVPPTAVVRLAIYAAWGSIAVGVPPAASAPPPGTQVYSNDRDSIAFFLSPGEGIAIADDLTLTAATGDDRGTTEAGCDVIYYDLLVVGGGGGDGVPPATFDVHAELWDADPCAAGVLIPGSAFDWSGVPDDDAVHVLSALLPNTVAVPPTVWLSVSFSTSDAGWLIAERADVGETGDFFALIDPANETCGQFRFGPFPFPYAGFWASVRCDLTSDLPGACCVGESCMEVAERECAGAWQGLSTSCPTTAPALGEGGLGASASDPNPCAPTFRVYENDFVTGAFFPLELGTRAGDDLMLDQGNTPCDFARYEVAVTGEAGTPHFDATIELWTNDVGPDGVISSDDLPLAPIPGTNSTFTQIPANQLTHWLTLGPFPAGIILFDKVWLIVSTTTGTSGPILSGLGDIGASSDAFAISDGENWTGGVDFGGFDPTGCPGGPSCTPAGSFRSRVWCYGATATGACCDAASGVCVEGVVIRNCNGRWVADTTCQSAGFDPPCGTAACCKVDSKDPVSTICDNQPPAECLRSGGEVATGLFCPEVDCGFAACIAGGGSCLTAHTPPGCSDNTCCNLICRLDPSCCQTEWDSACASRASFACPPAPPANDACLDALQVVIGETAFDTLTATTDGPPLADGCESVASAPATGGIPRGGRQAEGFSLFNDVWFQWVATGDHMVTVDLCTDTDFDARLVVYEGCSCPPLTPVSAGCDDDGCGLIAGPSTVTIGVTAGTCYLIRIGGFAAADVGDGVLTLTEQSVTCPAGSLSDAEHTVVFIDPPDNVVDARQPHAINSPALRQGIEVLTVEAPAGADPDCFVLCETEVESALSESEVASEPAAGGTPSGRRPKGVEFAPAASGTPRGGHPKGVASAPVAGGTPRSVRTGSSNRIVSVLENPPGVYTITLERTITVGAVTTVTYKGTGATGHFTSHPANVNGDAMADRLDVLRAIDCVRDLNRTATPPTPPYQGGERGRGARQLPSTSRRPPTAVCPTASHQPPSGESEPCIWGIYSADVDQDGQVGPADILRTIDLLNGAGSFDAWDATPAPPGDGCP